ncbi:MAG: NFACT family protein [Fimbriimonadaceae bacterium]
MNLRTPFDSITLAAVLDECTFLVGAKVQRIIQPDDQTILIGLYKSGDEHQLLINLHPDLYRAHILSRRPQAPTDPPTFCMTLRKYIGGGRLEFIRQRGLDRIIDLGFTSAHGDFQLVAELMGKHSNVILVDSNRRILAAAKTVLSKLSRRPIQVGKLYEPPPFELKPSLLEAKPGDDLKQFEGFSPFLSRLLDSHSRHPGESRDPHLRSQKTVDASHPYEKTDSTNVDQSANHPSLLAEGLGWGDLTNLQTTLRTKSWNPHFSDQAGAYPLDFTALDPTALPRQSISLALENAYALRESRNALHGQRQQLQSQLQRVADARNVALRGIEEAIATANRANQIQSEAELILAYQGTIKIGDKTLEAYDYEGNPKTIKLDPERTAVENANRLFNKAKHAKERRSEVESQQQRLAFDLAQVNSLLTKLEQAITSQELDDLKEVAKTKNYLHTTGAPKAKEDRPFEGHAIRELLSPGGYRILYGTNATSNDFLTTRVAKGNDLWFHVRGQTSAHVILQTAGNPDKVQKPDLIFAAQISVRNSVAKHGSYVPVDYTLKKYVRKPRGSAAGLAIYEREKTLHVDP